MATTYELIKDSFADYLTKPFWDWSWYATQTFDPRKVNPYKRLCEHSWRFFLSRIAETACMSYGFCFSETHRSGMRHWHALVHVRTNLLDQPQRKDIWTRMFTKYGRMEIQPYKPGNFDHTIKTVSSGIARYLTKYVVKESARDDAWWDFNGNISGSEADPSEIMAAIGAPVAGELPF